MVDLKAGHASFTPHAVDNSAMLRDVLAEVSSMRAVISRIETRLMAIEQKLTPERIDSDGGPTT